MHVHKFEKIWLIFGVSSLILFLLIIGVSAFTLGHQPAGGDHAVHPEHITLTEPFDNPGVVKLDDNTYQVALIAKTFGYEPNKITVPVDKKIIFKVTSPDVTHSFSIVDTNVNMMVVPGQVNTKEYTFTEEGNYLVICNEYCGTGHQYMKTEIEVVAHE